MIDLGNCGGTIAAGTAINNNSQVLGFCNLPGDASSHFFFWDQDRFIDINASTTGAAINTANALNDAGEIVGAAGFPDHPYDAYIWRDGSPTDLGFLEGDCFSEAFAMNSRSQVVGQSYSCDGTVARVFLWQDGRMFDISSLISTDTTFRVTQAFVINERGEI